MPMRIFDPNVLSVLGILDPFSLGRLSIVISGKLVHHAVGIRSSGRSWSRMTKEWYLTASNL